MTKKATLPGDDNERTVHAQNLGVVAPGAKRVVLPPLGQPAVRLVEQGDEAGLLIVLWIDAGQPDALIGGADTGTEEPGVPGERRKSWIHANGTRDVLDALGVSQSSWFGCSSTAAECVAWVTRVR